MAPMEYPFQIVSTKTNRIVKNELNAAAKLAGRPAEFMLHPSGRMCVVDDQGYARFTDKYYAVFTNRL